jgi:acyl transferase domain-containing protein/acyl carrier protein
VDLRRLEAVILRVTALGNAPIGFERAALSKSPRASAVGRMLVFPETDSRCGGAAQKEQDIMRSELNGAEGESRSGAGSPEPIAIVGIGCRFPGASGPERFFENLCAGEDAVREVPADRWDVERLFDPDGSAPGRMNSRHGGFLRDVDQFDWKALRIPPREASFLDPQQRLLLEVAWEAFEDAGLPLEWVAGSRTGVFLGLMWNDFLRRLSAHLESLNGYALTGNMFAFAPNRISFFFDLKGPSMAVDAACASSLACLQAACLSLWADECDMALVGGASLMLHPDAAIMLSKAGVLSPQGACRALDASADGFVRGEGAGVVVLKPRSKVNAADRVYAYVRGVAVRHNGRNEWIMAANAAGQSRTLREAYRRAGVDPSQVDYVELHGTGLLKGDALEVGVLGEVLGRCPGRRHPCRVGSVKTNIGHLEAAAGIAGLIKVALALHHGQIPPTRNLLRVNPAIDFENLGLRPQLTLGPWPERQGPAVAGVSAISMSGVNAHAVLEAVPNAPPERAAGGREAPSPYVLPISARTAGALRRQAQAVAEALRAENGAGAGALSDVCFTAAVRRSHHEFRTAVVGETRAQLAAALSRWLESEPVPSAAAHSPPSVVFVFSGRVPADWRLNRSPLPRDELFCSVAERCRRVFREGFRRPAAAGVPRDPSGLRLKAVDRARWELAAVQMATVALWLSWGVTPSACLVSRAAADAAARLDEQVDLEEEIRVCFGLNPVQSRGGGADAGRPDRDPTAERLFPVRKETLFPKFGAPRIVLFEEPPSADEGEAAGAPRADRAALEAALAASVGELGADAAAHYLEIGPRLRLSRHLTNLQTRQRIGGRCLMPASAEAVDRHLMVQALAQLYRTGWPVRWSGFYAHGGRCVHLPPYPWERERLWPPCLDAEARGGQARPGRRLEGPNAASAPPSTGNQDGSAAAPQNRSDGGDLGMSSVRTLSAAWRNTPRTGPLRPLLVGVLSSHLIDILGFERGVSLDPHRRLFELGMNSLATVELMRRLELEIGRRFPPTLIFDYPTIDGLAGCLERELSDGPEGPPRSAQRPGRCEGDRPAAAVIDQLSEAEADELLRHKLDALERKWT